ncbi:hypothetical protein, partial [Oleiagrimonas sp.]|uniref:hypothetical protein n=1 Tax=Oleiagrimonas sp. TaxID=2010330 RepID=UPI00261E383B
MNSTTSPRLLRRILVCCAKKSIAASVERLRRQNLPGPHQLKDTLGGAAASGFSRASGSAAWKPKLPA